MYRRFIWVSIILIGILLVGTVGFWVLGDYENSIIDALYMTFITITTIGYGEVVNLHGEVAGRIFTMLIAISGIGVLAYTITSFTALFVEGQLTKSFRRRRMEKVAGNLEGHYIICGIGEVGLHIAEELRNTGREYVIVEPSKDTVEKLLESLQNELVIIGDATDNDTLLKAGVDKARGLFAVTPDDNDNLVICLTTRQLNPEVKIVGRCNEVKNREKMKRAGAGAVIAPSLIGALRMASEMVRPTAVNFLDMMLRDQAKNLRVEEVSVPEHFAGKTISALNLKKHQDVLLLAVKAKNRWVYNPAEDYVLESEDTLIFMTTPKERQQLYQILHVDA